MKAVIAQKYGPPEVLQIVDIKKPTINSNEVLVKIKASAVNAADVRARTLTAPMAVKPIMRLILGLKRPKKPMGAVFAGVVEDIGKNVEGYKKGDKVYALSGIRFGGNAEYTAFPEDKAIALMPKNASFEQAAAIPFGGTTALYFLNKTALGKKPNQKVLIYGSSGAVGTAAVQIAKHYGAEVTSVCGKDGAELSKSLGSDHIIVYTEEDFAENGQSYDIIFDAVGKRSRKECRNSLNKNGNFISVKGFDVAKGTGKQLKLLSEMFDKNQFVAVIDRTYSLEQIVDAHRYVDLGKKKGNVVIKIS